MNSNEIPFYMKQKIFSITTKLENLIENLPQKEKEIYCHIFSYIRLNNGAEIRREIFYNIAGGNKYVDYLKQLQEWKMIETDDYSFSFQNGYSKCKRWKILDKSEPIKKRFDCRPKYEKDETEILNNIMNHVHKCLNQLVVAKNISESDNPDTAFLQNIWWKTFESKAWDIKYGKNDQTRRLFHNFISSPKIVRKDLRHNQRKILCEFDITACHTIFLLKWCPESEKDVYKKLLENDIYETLAKTASISRKEMKLEFLYWANGKGYSTFSKELRKYCPILVENYSNGRKEKSMSLEFQKIESSLMLLQFGKWCVENNIFYINTHDGWCGKQSESEICIEKVKEIFVKEFDFEPKITSKRVEEI